MSIVSVFTVMLLAYLLGMVINSGVVIDRKVKMQNAADSAAYAGSTVVAQSMNTLAFTNHLLSDVFALTAFMREAETHAAQSLTPEILRNWARVGPAFAESEFGKFADLGIAIEEKVPHEAEVVLTFNVWAGAASELMLPVFEQILAEHRIPEFQQALVQTCPHLAQIATHEIAGRHGNAWPRPVELHGELWCGGRDPAVRVDETSARLLPVVHPVADGLHVSARLKQAATEQRFILAHSYLRSWNAESLPVFDRYAKMSQFAGLWRIFTGGQLEQLLNEEYPHTNLPCQITPLPPVDADNNAYLNRYHMFVARVRGPRPSERIPGVFRNPSWAQTQAYAQAMTFVPQRRLIKKQPGSWGTRFGSPPPISGVPGQTGVGTGLPPPAPSPPPVPPPPPDDDDEDDDAPRFVVVRQSARYYPETWNLVTQNWTAQLVPATSRTIPRMLASVETVYSDSADPPEVPDREAITVQDFLWLSNH